MAAGLQVNYKSSAAWFLRCHGCKWAHLCWNFCHTRSVSNILILKISSLKMIILSKFTKNYFFFPLGGDVCNFAALVKYIYTAGPWFTVYSSCNIVLTDQFSMGSHYLIWWLLLQLMMAVWYHLSHPFWPLGTLFCLY